MRRFLVIGLIIGAALAFVSLEASAQVAPDRLQSSLLKKSLKGVLGTEDQVSWQTIALDDSTQQAIEGQLKQIKHAPDTLYVGHLSTDQGDYLLIPDIAPSRSEVFSFVLYLDSSLEIYDVDVLAYRENYGYEIDFPMFRNQYKGKSKPGDVIFGRTIQNISGATISARSLTQAVHDLLAIIQPLENQLKP